MIILRRALVVVGLLLRAIPIVANDAGAIDPAAHRRFADNLTAILHSNPNECSSALGVSMAFSLIYPGCVGDAVEEVRSSLGYPEGTNARLVWKNSTERLLANSDGASSYGASGPLLKIANAVWFDERNALDGAYADVVGTYANQIDFLAEDSPAIVNRWVNESTNGAIESILAEDGPLFPPSVLVAVNTIYLKAAWEDAFKEYKTNTDSFESLGASGTMEAHFMNAVERFEYSHDALPGHQIVKLPFKNSQISMVFVLRFAPGREAVRSADLVPALEKLEPTRVALSVPKFRFESKYERRLKEGLVAAGVRAPFAKGSGALCGILQNKTGCELLEVDEMIQMTVIDVNEDGVEAAAATGFGMGITSVVEDPAVLMVLDRPFQFFIYDQSEGLVLFEGRVGLPTIQDDWPAPEVDWRRSDADFWMEMFGVEPIQGHPGCECLDEKGACAEEVKCAVNPCDAEGVCKEGEVCTPDYCGGCNVVCETEMTPVQPVNPSGTSAPSSKPTNQVQPVNPSETGDTPSATGSSAPSSKPTTQPSAAPALSTSQPTKAPSDLPTPSSANMYQQLFSLFTCLVLALAPVFVW